MIQEAGTFISNNHQPATGRVRVVFLSAKITQLRRFAFPLLFRVFFHLISLALCFIKSISYKQHVIRCFNPLFFHPVTCIMSNSVLALLFHQQTTFLLT
jgi:hypothetical protein